MIQPVPMWTTYQCGLWFDDWKPRIGWLFKLTSHYSYTGCNLKVVNSLRTERESLNLRVCFNRFWWQFLVWVSPSRDELTKIVVYYHIMAQCFDYLFAENSFLLVILWKRKSGWRSCYIAMRQFLSGCLMIWKYRCFRFIDALTFGRVHIYVEWWVRA